jgi:hypothetical protein
LRGFRSGLVAPGVEALSRPPTYQDRRTPAFGRIDHLVDESIQTKRRRSRIGSERDRQQKQSLAIRKPKKHDDRHRVTVFLNREKAN